MNKISLFSSKDLEDSLEEEMTTHSSILAWKITRTEEPGGLYFMRLQRGRCDLGTNQKDGVWICSKRSSGYNNLQSKLRTVDVLWHGTAFNLFFCSLAGTWAILSLGSHWIDSTANALTSFISKLKRANGVCLQLQIGVVKIQMFVLSIFSDSFIQLRSIIKGLQQWDMYNMEGMHWSRKS